MKLLIIAIISLFIVDSKTKEALPGVEVKNLTTNETYYTDLEGRVKLCGDSCDYQISYVSYSDTIISNINSNTIIEIK